MKQIGSILLCVLFLFGAFAQAETVLLPESSDTFQIEMLLWENCSLENDMAQNGFNLSTVHGTGAADVHIAIAPAENYANVDLSNLNSDTDAELLQEIANFCMGTEENTVFELMRTPVGNTYLALSVSEDGAFSCNMMLYQGYMLVFTQYKDDFSALQDADGVFMARVLDALRFLEQR